MSTATGSTSPPGRGRIPRTGLPRAPRPATRVAMIAAHVTRRSRAVLVAAFFLSGASGLVYEVVWSRDLHLVFGSTTYSIATVVAAYMLGLGGGGLLFGRIADRTPRPA